MSIQINQWLSMEEPESVLLEQFEETRQILAGIQRRNKAAVKRNNARNDAVSSR